MRSTTDHVQHGGDSAECRSGGVFGLRTGIMRELFTNAGFWVLAIQVLYFGIPQSFLTAQQRVDLLHDEAVDAQSRGPLRDPT